MTCSVVLPWPPKELNPNKRLHWSTKRKHVAKYRAMCFALAREAGIAVDWDGDVHLWVDFYPPDKRRRDDDNVIAAFKAGRDGLRMLCVLMIRVFDCTRICRRRRAGLCW